MSFITTKWNKLQIPTAFPKQTVLCIRLVARVCLCRVCRFTFRRGFTLRVNPRMFLNTVLIGNKLTHIHDLVKLLRPLSKATALITAPSPLNTSHHDIEFIMCECTSSLVCTANSNHYRIRKRTPGVWLFSTLPGRI